MHPVRLEPTKLSLIGTRTTYQATGDAGNLDTRFPSGRCLGEWRKSGIIFVCMKSCTPDL